MVLWRGKRVAELADKEVVAAIHQMEERHFHWLGPFHDLNRAWNAWQALNCEAERRGLLHQL